MFWGAHALRVARSTTTPDHPIGLHFSHASADRTALLFAGRCPGGARGHGSCGLRQGIPRTASGTSSAFKACQNSNDCGAGHSPSRSPTNTSNGVLAFLMCVIGELLAYAAGIALKRSAEERQYPLIDVVFAVIAEPVGDSRARHRGLEMLRPGDGTHVMNPP